LQPPTDPLPVTTIPVTTIPANTAPPSAAVPRELELLTSWPDGAEIPVRHTCDDVDVSPALTWTNVPAGSTELAITVTDLDAAGFVHWIVYGIDPAATALAEGTLPENTYQWVNDFGVEGYGGPCPPAGQDHRYIFTVHALNQQLELADDASADEVISILNMTAITQSSLTGTYVRPG